MKKKDFNYEKISCFTKFSNDFFKNGVEVNFGLHGNDFVEDKVTALIEARIMSRFLDQQIVSFQCERPTFFDWFFRRRKTQNFDVLTKIVKKWDESDEEEGVKMYEVKKIT